MEHGTNRRRERSPCDRAQDGTTRSQARSSTRGTACARCDIAPPAAGRWQHTMCTSASGRTANAQADVVSTSYRRRRTSIPLRALQVFVEFVPVSGRSCQRCAAYYLLCSRDAHPTADYSATCTAVECTTVYYRYSLRHSVTVLVSTCLLVCVGGGAARISPDMEVGWRWEHTVAEQSRPVVVSSGFGCA